MITNATFLAVPQKAPIFASAGRKKGYHNKQGKQYRREAGSRHQEGQAKTKRQAVRSYKAEKEVEIIAETFARFARKQ